jgi:hypothetical protein
MGIHENDGEKISNVDDYKAFTGIEIHGVQSYAALMWIRDASQLASQYVGFISSSVFIIVYVVLII